MKLALDLTQVAFVREHHDTLVLGTWYLPTGEPCLAIVRKGKLSNKAATKPCIVLLHNAWIWNEQEGDPRACARICTQFLQAMDQDVTQLAAQRLAGIIHDNLQDLLSIPPKPKTGDVAADVEYTDQHGQRRTAQVVH